MAANASQVYELPVIDDNVSFEIEDATPARVALDSDEFCGRGSPRIIGNSAALRRVLSMVRVVAPSRRNDRTRPISPRPFLSAQRVPH